MEQIKKLDKMIKNKQNEVLRWNDTAKGITSSSQSVLVKRKINGQEKYELQNMERVQGSGSGDKVGDAVAEYTTLEAEIVELKAKRKCIIKTIELLNYNEYDLLYHVYVNCFTIKAVASFNHKSNSWAVKMHQKALKNLQKILDEREKHIKSV